MKNSKLFKRLHNRLLKNNKTKIPTFKNSGEIILLINKNNLSQKLVLPKTISKKNQQKNSKNLSKHKKDIKQSKTLNRKSQNIKVLKGKSIRTNLSSLQIKQALMKDLIVIKDITIMIDQKTTNEKKKMLL